MFKIWNYFSFKIDIFNLNFLYWKVKALEARKINRGQFFLFLHVHILQN